MKHYRYFLLACVAILMFVSCRESHPTHIKIVCTSDVHGHLFPYDFLTGDSARGSLARVSSYLKEQRRQGTSVVYVDNGDMLQGTPATYCYNTYAVGHPHVAAEALNYLACDAVVLGNNDIEPGGPTYQRYVNNLNAQTIGANIVYKDTEDPFLPPYTIVEREGVKIAVLGLTTPAIPHWIPKCQWPELAFDDMERSAHHWMQYLRERETPDLVIGLFHSGYQGGITTNSYAENATLAVAERVPGFDAIFYGHDHQARTTQVVNVEGDTVLLLNPGRDAHSVATLDIVPTREGSFTLSSALVDVDAYAPDEEYMTTFAPHIERVNKYVNRTIGTSTHAATMSDALLGPSALLDFMHKMQLDITGAKISFADPLMPGIALPEGEVTVRDIYRLYPYENTLYVLLLTGCEVKNYLELSYDRWLSHQATPGSRAHFDSAAGIIYEVNRTRPIGKRVTIRHMADGTPFNPDQRYMVAMNSFRAHGGGGLMPLGAGITHEQLQERIVYSTTADLRFYMINYIEMRKTVTPERLNHWTFVR